MTPVARTCLHVLLIDDDDPVAGSLGQYLTIQGCDVPVPQSVVTIGELASELPSLSSKGHPE